MQGFHNGIVCLGFTLLLLFGAECSRPKSEREMNLINYAADIFKLDLLEADNSKIYVIFQSHLCITCIEEDIKIIRRLSEKEDIYLFMEESQEMYGSLQNERIHFYIDSIQQFEVHGMTSGYIEVVVFKNGQMVFWEKLDGEGRQKVIEKFKLS